MLLLMRREGEAVRVNETITIEIQKINEQEVVLVLNGISHDKIKLAPNETEAT